jgi:uncharacterized protein
MAMSAAGIAMATGLTFAALNPERYATPAHAQPIPSNQVAQATGITVVGDGVVRVQPDVATIRLGVQVTARTPAEALSQTRSATDRLLQLLRERGVPEGDIQTSGLNVWPIQAPSREGPPDPLAIAGYRGTATVVVQSQDVNRVGGLLDAAVQAGATSIQGLSYGVRDDAELRRQALVAAIQDARPKAEAAAAATGMTITGVRTIVEHSVGPPRMLGLGGGGEGIAPGELNVVAQALVTYDVSR